MKKSLVILSLATVLCLAWCWWSWNVVEYNDWFVDLVKACTDSTQTLFNDFEKEDSSVDSIMESLDNSIKICKDSESKASKMGSYDWDSSLRDAVAELLSTEVQYLQIFAWTSRYWNLENITDEDKVAYDSVVNELYQMEEVLNHQFTTLQQVQEWFAAKHWLKLE